MNKLYLHAFNTRFGTIRTAATENGLAMVALREPLHSFQARIKRRFAVCDVLPGGRINREAERQIKAFLTGRLKQFSIKLDVQGTLFQKKVLRRVARIPYGQTMRYGEIARAVGHPNAFRAVGTANARNDLPLVIPCHRVVARNGLGGYGGGVRLKRELLKMEGAL